MAGKRRREHSEEALVEDSVVSRFSQPLYPTFERFLGREQSFVNSETFLDNLGGSNSEGWVVVGSGAIYQVATKDCSSGLHKIARILGHAKRIVGSEDGTLLFVQHSDFSSGQREELSTVNVSTGAVTPLADSIFDSTTTMTGLHQCTAITIDPVTTTLFAASWCGVSSIHVRTAVRKAVAIDVRKGEFSPTCMSFAQAGPAAGKLVVAEDHSVSIVDVATGCANILAGSHISDGWEWEASWSGVAGPEARFRNIVSMTLTADGTSVYLVDVYEYEDDWGFESKVRHVDVASGTVTTVVHHHGQLAGIALSADERRLAVTAWPVSDQPDELAGILTCPLPMAPRVTIPPSTLTSDLRSTRGDTSLPGGFVSFVVGSQRQRINGISKTLLAVRSEYFKLMFQGNTVERDALEVEVPDANFAAFESMIDYLVSDEFKVDQDTRHAFDVMCLAKKYQIRRLELLSLDVIECSLRPDRVVQLLEGADGFDCERLFQKCRRYIGSHRGLVKRSGGIAQLHNLETTNGLLGDAIEQNTALEYTVEVLRGRLKEAQRTE